MADARSLARQALQDVRGSVGALRGDEFSAPLSAMLAHLVQQAGPGEPLVTLTVTGDEAGVCAAARTVLFRTAQEALTNARRHSGAGQVRVAVTVDDRERGLSSPTTAGGLTRRSAAPSRAGRHNTDLAASAC